jgi:hypothetical protein
MPLYLVPEIGLIALRQRLLLSPHLPSSVRTLANPRHTPATCSHPTRPIASTIQQSTTTSVCFAGVTPSTNRLWHDMTTLSLSLSHHRRHLLLCSACNPLLPPQVGGVPRLFRVARTSPRHRGISVAQGSSCYFGP